MTSDKPYDFNFYLGCVLSELLADDVFFYWLDGEKEIVQTTVMPISNILVGLVIGLIIDKVKK